MDLTDIIVSTYSVLTIAGQIIVIGILLFWLTGIRSVWLDFLARRGLPLMLLVAFLATVGSLYFSEIAGWEPCRLCWYQRIFMYPQVLLLGYALWKRDYTVAPYIFLLSFVGLFIAFYHYGEQVTAALFPAVIDPSVPCDESGVSCAATPFFHFGYVTIPLMAATAFALNIAGSLLYRRQA
jgi:disulfide bond formation protein DsbB